MPPANTDTQRPKIVRLCDPNDWLHSRFGCYAKVGTADNPKRTFQTMTKLSEGLGSSLTAKELDYQYDSGGRLTGSAFAQTPFTGFTPSGSNPWYNSSHPAQSRAREFYAFDAGGRTLACEHYWEALTSGTTAYGTPTTIALDDCTYDGTTGLKNYSTFTVPTISGSSWTDSFTYDSQLDYLASATYGTSPTVSWTYDAAGNRTDSPCDNLNRTLIPGSSPPTTNCDILGNRLTLGSSTTYTWDLLNRMTGLTASGTTSSYVYRADGMRSHKTVGSVNTEYYHDGQMPIEDAVINGTTLTATRYGLGARGVDYEEEGVGTWTNSTTRSPGAFSNVGYPIYDAHGNMIATLARSGSNWYSVNNQRTYDAWGTIRTGATSADPKNRYCANLCHQQDDESGLVFMRSRYYEAGSGRFVSPDALRDGWNWLVYCECNPVCLVDFSGNDDFSLGSLSAGTTGTTTIATTVNGTSIFATFGSSEETTTLYVTINQIIGARGISAIMTSIRAQAVLAGFANILFKVGSSGLADGNELEKFIDVAMTLINRMGDRGRLIGDDAVTQLWWLLSG